MLCLEQAQRYIAVGGCKVVYGFNKQNIHILYILYIFMSPRDAEYSIFLPNVSTCSACSPCSNREMP